MAFLIHKHRKKRKRHFFKKETRFDKLVDTAAFVYPIVGIPQVIVIFQGNTDGVSLLYWLGVGVFTILFLVYGIKHRTPPMIITYSLWLVINTLVLVGLFIDRY